MCLDSFNFIKMLGGDMNQVMLWIKIPTTIQKVAEMTSTLKTS